jgi:hypothetical protein
MFKGQNCTAAYFIQKTVSQRTKLFLLSSILVISDEILSVVIYKLNKG